MGNKLRGIVVFALLILLASPVASYATQGTNDSGIPYWRIPQQRPVTLKPIVITDSQGRVVELTSAGEVPVNASVTVSSGNSIVVDDEGDTDNFRVNYKESSPIHKSISPGNSTTLSFAESRHRVSVTPHNGEIRYAYANTADTNDVPVAQLQRVDNANLGVSQLTLFVPYTESSTVDVTVEVFD